ncbi:MAG: glycosyltransferase family 2 protein [Algoriphagus sp.]|nr:glycosyltransferase family 2 protein [Algoriphagus sp.]
MLVSIIIPCFNSGQFVLEALGSCLDSTFKDFEIILVDDGSSDFRTIEVLKEISRYNSVKLIKKKNQGAASARNTGVKHSNGEFLFFLDSDNKIKSDYLEKAVHAIQRDVNIGVVYAKPFFFGFEENQESNRFEVSDFSLDSLLSRNYVDMCSLVRKKAFLEVGGFDENREIFFGEDWDLWIRMAQTGWAFHLLNEVLFYYRIRKGSLMDQVDAPKRESTLRYLGTKHGFIIHQRYRQYFRLMEKIQAKPLSFFLRIIYYKYILRKPILK